MEEGWDNRSPSSSVLTTCVQNSVTYQVTLEFHVAHVRFCRVAAVTEITIKLLFYITYLPCTRGVTIETLCSAVKLRPKPWYKCPQSCVAVPEERKAEDVVHALKPLRSVTSLLKTEQLPKVSLIISLKHTINFPETVCKMWPSNV